MENVQKLLIRNSEGKNTLVRSRNRWEYNIQIDLKKCMIMWIAFNYLRIRTSGKFLRVR
jgi:hypothetical protein